MPLRETIRRARLKFAQEKDQPWEKPDAQIIFNALAEDLDRDLLLTNHAIERMEERSLSVNDARAVLGRGMIEKCAEYNPEKRSYVYLFFGRTWNPGTRDVRCVATPIGKTERIKIMLITIMWKDAGDWKQDLRK